jgi:FKBP-type peptidyl-prolyl cis-trans isomerase FkpA
MMRTKTLLKLTRLLAAAGLAFCGVSAAQAQTAPAAGAASAAPRVATPAAATVVTTQSGLIFRSLKEGKGDSPVATDTVRVHYRGTFPDGKEFDSSYSRGKPTEFPLNRVIPCWTEGVQRMKVGGKAQLTCPPEIAYGSRGAGGVIPPGATLNFEIELLAILKP